MVNNGFVVSMGMGTVFVGLICIVFLCMAMSKIIQKFQKVENVSGMQQSAMVSTGSMTPTGSMTLPIADRQAIIAATCAVIAEELGTDVKNIKVVSFKRV